MNKRSKNPTGLIIHCSDSVQGDVDLINKWHKERGWDTIGYNWVLLNGQRLAYKYKPEDDGILEWGRDASYIGAHAEGYNESHLSICLIGKYHFTWKQIY